MTSRYTIVSDFICYSMSFIQHNFWPSGTYGTEKAAHTVLVAFGVSRAPGPALVSARSYQLHQPHSSGRQNAEGVE